MGKLDDALAQIAREAETLRDSTVLGDADVRRAGAAILAALERVRRELATSARTPARGTPSSSSAETRRFGAMPMDEHKRGAVSDELREAWERGNAAFAAGDYDAAELPLRMCVKLDASLVAPLYMLARCLLENPRYERSGSLPVARSLLDRAVQIAPDNTQAVELRLAIVREMGAADAS